MITLFLTRDVAIKAISLASLATHHLQKLLTRPKLRFQFAVVLMHRYENLRLSRKIGPADYCPRRAPSIRCFFASIIDWSEPRLRSRSVFENNLRANVLEASIIDLRVLNDSLNGLAKHLLDSRGPTTAHLVGVVVLLPKSEVGNSLS